MENKSFEEYINDLENILKSLENRDITLDDAVKNYTKGVEISKKCYQILDSNEKLVISQMTDSGLVDFDPTKNN